MELGSIIIMIILGLFGMNMFLPMFFGSGFDDEDDDFESDNDFDDDGMFDIF